ncbi:MAG TPA: fibronectin type III domain-containing protein [Candidatus Eisenbacteria bacterium]|nr:fibronectin type III domain-containing protein [Candidatus Eisenbacteria bacterium]
MHEHRPIVDRARRRTAALTPWILAALLALAVGIAGTPATANAQTSADSSVTLLWTAPGDDGTVGRATAYDIRYRTVTISGTDTLSWWNAATQATGEPVPGNSGATDSMRVRGLLPLTTYYFMIRAADEVPNWSGFSNVATKTTSGDNTAPSAVADLSVTGVTGTSISVRWTAPGDDGATGTASSYDIRYSTSAITSANWGSATQATGEPLPAASGTQQTFTLGGLAGSRTYYIAIRATDDRGNVSLLSNVVNGTTTDTQPPAAVRDLSLLDLGGPERASLARVGPSETDEKRHAS